MKQDANNTLKGTAQVKVLGKKLSIIVPTTAGGTKLKMYFQMFISKSTNSKIKAKVTIDPTKRGKNNLKI